MHKTMALDATTGELGTNMEEQRVCNAEYTTTQVVVMNDDSEELDSRAFTLSLLRVRVSASSSNAV